MACATAKDSVAPPDTGSETLFVPVGDVTADLGPADSSPEAVGAADLAPASDLAPPLPDAPSPSDVGLLDVAVPDLGPPTPDVPPTFKDSYPITAAHPEGGIYDPTTHAFYVGSLGNGSVNRIEVGSGKETPVFLETAPGTWWTLGMDLDDERRRLWVCAMDDRSPKPRAGIAWVLDLNTHQRIATHPLESAAKDATCTDVALLKDGRAFVVDREAPNLYQVDLVTGPTLFATHPYLKGDVVGQNAAVVLPDESALLTITYLAPSLVRVDLADKSVTRVVIDGPFLDTSLLAGADGMVYANDSVYVVFTSKLVRVTPLDKSWSQASSKEVDLPTGMTDAVRTPEGLYLLNGQAIQFALKAKTDPFALVRFTGDL